MSCEKALPTGGLLSELFSPTEIDFNQFVITASNTSLYMASQQANRNVVGELSYNHTITLNKSVTDV